MLKSIVRCSLFLLAAGAVYEVIDALRDDAALAFRADFLITMAVTGALGGYWDWRRQRRTVEPV